MYKFGPSVSYNLREAEQVNALRWEILYRDEDLFTPQTAVFKCKDYFNDVVAAYHGYFGIAYGLNNAHLKLNEGGVWVRLHNVNNKDGVFVDNINAVLQAELVGSLGIEVELEELDHTTFLMFFPRKMFDHTWTISLATYVIRLCNYGKSYASLDALLKAPLQEESHFTPLVRQNKFNLPKGLEPFWYFAGAAYNSNSTKNMMLIHNNGIAGVSAAYNQRPKEVPCDAIAATTC